MRAAEVKENQNHSISKKKNNDVKVETLNNVYNIDIYKLCNTKPFEFFIKTILNVVTGKKNQKLIQYIFFWF